MRSDDREHRHDRAFDGDAADASLAAPAGASRLPNGNIVVGDLGEYALKEFAPSGKLVKRYGRKGHGPGEISYLAPLLRCGESLVANDIDGLTSIFRPNGTFGRAFRMVPQPYRFRCNARMQFAVMGWSTGVKAGVYRQVAPYWIARADTSAIIPLGDLPGSERMGVPGGDGPYPLGREPRVAMGASRAYVALSDSFEVKAFGLNGKPLPSMFARVPRVVATTADLDAEKERQIAMMGEGTRAQIERAFAGTPLAKYLPSTRDLIVDSDDNLWVQHYPRASSQSVAWTVFSADGTMRATVLLPTALEVYEIGRDYVLGRYVDADESVPEVRLYALTRK